MQALKIEIVVLQVRRDPRMSLLGTDLTISRVGIHDGGLYR